MAEERGLTLVTGANGFIGRHLVSALAGLGRPTRVLMRPSTHPPTLAGAPEIVLGDLLDGEGLERATAGVDTCIHLAAQPSVAVGAEDPTLTMRTNATAVADLLAACRRSGVRRFVLVSTNHVFGPVPAHLLTESTPFDPRSVYAASKLEAERHALSLGGELEVVVLRPSNVYGPGQSRAAVVPNLVARAIAGEAMVVKNPAARRDFVYVGDIVEALVAAASAPAAAGQAINLGSGRDIAIGELARIIWRVAGQAAMPGSALADDDAAAGERPRGAGTPAERLLGWRATTPLLEGIAACVAAERVRLRHGA